MTFKELFKKILYLVCDSYPWIYKPEYKIFNHKIEIHKTDKDIWPSYPHVHFSDDDIKLDIYTGNLYRIQTKKIINTVSNEDMEKLWNDKKFLEIVVEARKNKPINISSLKEIPFKWINDENKDMFFQN